MNWVFIHFFIEIDVKILILILFVEVCIVRVDKDFALFVLLGVQNEFFKFWKRFQLYVVSPWISYLKSFMLFLCIM